jgi:hypothetical protein
MMGESISPAKLKPGDRITGYRGDVVVTVLGEKEPHTDRFGRSGLFKYWARREDTGAEGYITFGHGAIPVVRLSEGEE